MTDYSDIDQLLNRHRWLIERLCMQATYGDAEQCADMIQECYMAIWRQHKKLRANATEREVRSWLKWQCRHVISNMLRRHRHRMLPLDDYLADTIAAPDDSGNGELIEELAANLNPRYRLILALMLEGYTTAEIAAELHLSPENAKTLRRRLIEHMRHTHETITKHTITS